MAHRGGEGRPHPHFVSYPEVASLQGSGGTEKHRNLIVGVTDGINDAWDPLTTGPFVGRTGAWADGSNLSGKQWAAFPLDSAKREECPTL